MASSSLNDLLKSISVAIRESQNILEDHALHSYKNMFHKHPENDSFHAPKTIALPIPDKSSSSLYRTAEVPVVSLLHHHNLSLSEVKIHLALHADWDQEKQNVMVKVRSPQDENATESKSICDLELVFKAEPTPEGKARITDKFTDNL